MGRFFRRYEREAEGAVQQSPDIAATVAHLERPPDFQFAPRPMPLVLNCPSCGFPHEDKGYWATRLHKTHLCASCRFEWRPCDLYTVGVLVLPAQTTSSPGK